MPTIYTGHGWKITMYYRDHEPPHFHIVTRDRRETQIRIEDLTVIIGDVQQKIVREALSWAAKNRAILLEKWQELHPA